MRRDRTKWILTAVVFLLIAVLLAGICLQLFGKGKVKPSEWFKKDEQAEDFPEESGGAVITESNSYGVSLLSEIIATEDYEENGISPQAENAYMLTATVTPDFAIDKTVDWSIRFTDPSSAWATGKTVTDYVTVTPTSDGALTANVTCLKAFGEEICIWVTSRQNTSAKANCFVDYVKKLVDMTVIIGTSMVGLRSGSPDGTTYLPVHNYTYSLDKHSDLSIAEVTACSVNTIGSRGKYETSVIFAPIWSVGTVDNEIAEEKVLLQVNRSNLATSGSPYPCTINDIPITAGVNSSVSDETLYNFTFNLPCLRKIMDVQMDFQVELMYKWINVELPQFTIKAILTSKTGEILEYSILVHLDISAAVAVSSVSLGGTEITF